MGLVIDRLNDSPIDLQLLGSGDRVRCVASSIKCRIGKEFIVAGVRRPDFKKDVVTREWLSLCSCYGDRYELVES